MSMDLIPAAVGMVARESFGERSIERSSETGTAALVAAAEAQMKGRFVMAMQRPRSWSQVEHRILQECKRPGFAEVARYAKPIGGGKITGPSVRLAEAFFRYAGNLGSDVAITFEDERRRLLRVDVIDYETNANFSATVTVEKTVERRDSGKRAVLFERENSGGQRVFIVAATEDELLVKQAALVSKAMRTLILRHIPGDIVEAAERACVETLERGAASDPDARRKTAAAFVQVGVQPAELERYLGHSLDDVTPAEHVDLKALWAALRDGEATWADVLATRGLAPVGGAAPAEPGQGAAKVTSVLDKARAAAEKAKAGKAARDAAKAAAKAEEKARAKEEETSPSTPEEPAADATPAPAETSPGPVEPEPTESAEPSA